MEATDDNNSELEVYVKKCKERLNTILEHLHWTEENVVKNFNTNSATFKTPTFHEESEPLLPESICNAENKIIVGENDLCQLINATQVHIPQRFSDIQINFNREQKLSIYEYVVANTKPNIDQDIQLSSTHDGKLSLAEIVAIKKREKKKRRYRTSKPTHIEEVRGLIDLQMQALQQYLGLNKKEEIYDERSKRKRSLSEDNRKSSPSSKIIHVARQYNNSKNSNYSCMPRSTSIERYSIGRRSREPRKKSRSKERRNFTQDERGIYTRKSSHHTTKARKDKSTYDNSPSQDITDQTVVLGKLTEVSRESAKKHRRKRSRSSSLRSNKRLEKGSSIAKKKKKHKKKRRKDSRDHRREEDYSSERKDTHHKHTKKGRKDKYEKF